MKTVLVVSPHADDETLGCGGTLLKHKNSGDNIFWLNMTKMGKEIGSTELQIKNRDLEIEAVATAYGFNQYKCLDYLTTRLSTYNVNDITKQVTSYIKKINPNIIYLPFPGDIHSEHKFVFEIAQIGTKWFRYPSVERVLAYETLSETDYSLNPIDRPFAPNVFINISEYIEMKISIMEIYSSELEDPPFPRCTQNIKALAHLRGCTSGFNYAESFMLLKERNN